MASLGDRVRARLDARQRGSRPIAVAVATATKFVADGGGRLAALVAYYGFIAVFPLLLVLVSVAGWVLAGRPDLQDRLVDSALAQFPVVGDEIRTNLGHFGGSGVALAVGVAGTLWGAWGALDSMRRAMSAIWAQPSKQASPGFLRARLRSLLLVVVLGLGVLATALAGIAADSLRPIGWLGRAVATIGPVVIAFGLFVAVFRVLAPIPLRVGEVVPGAVLAAVGWVALQLVGSALLSHQLRHASALYGVFGVVIGLLGWLYLQAQIVMFAAELNTVLRGHLWPVSLTGSLGEASPQVEQRLAQDA